MRRYPTGPRLVLTPAAGSQQDSYELVQLHSAPAGTPGSCTAPLLLHPHLVAVPQAALILLAMLDFLPLQPIASTSTAMPVGPLSPLSPVSPLELPEASCSLEALRSSLALALPPQPAYQRNLEFVTLPTPDKAPAESIADELVVRPLRRADVDQVRQLQVRTTRFFRARAWPN